MIVRVVLIRLKPQFQSYGQRRLIAKKTREVLPNAARVMSLTINLASDERTEDEWDICLLVKFASMQDTAVYKNDPVHRAYADVFLKPMLDRIYVYHFEDMS
jgi:hypothetical protein